MAVGRRDGDQEAGAVRKEARSCGLSVPKVLICCGEEQRERAVAAKLHSVMCLLDTSTAPQPHTLGLVGWRAAIAALDNITEPDRLRSARCPAPHSSSSVALQSTH